MFGVWCCEWELVTWCGYDWGMRENQMKEKYLSLNERRKKKKWRVHFVNRAHIGINIIFFVPWWGFSMSKFDELYHYISLSLVFAKFNVFSAPDRPSAQFSYSNFWHENHREWAKRLRKILRREKRERRTQFHFHPPFHLLTLPPTCNSNFLLSNRKKSQIADIVINLSISMMWINSFNRTEERFSPKGTRCDVNQESSQEKRKKLSTGDFATIFPLRLVLKLDFTSREFFSRRC